MRLADFLAVDRFDSLPSEVVAFESGGFDAAALSGPGGEDRGSGCASAEGLGATGDTSIVTSARAGFRGRPSNIKNSVTAVAAKARMAMTIAIVFR